MVYVGGIMQKDVGYSLGMQLWNVQNYFYFKDKDVQHMFKDQILD